MAVHIGLPSHLGIVPVGEVHMTMDELLRERERLEAYLQLINVRCEPRERALAELGRVKTRMANRAI